MARTQSVMPAIAAAAPSSNAVQASQTEAASVLAETRQEQPARVERLYSLTGKQKEIRLRALLRAVCWSLTVRRYDGTPF